MVEIIKDLERLRREYLRGFDGYFFHCPINGEYCGDCDDIEKLSYALLIGAHNAVLDAVIDNAGRGESADIPALERLRVDKLKAFYDWGFACPISGYCCNNTGKGTYDGKVNEHNAILDGILTAWKDKVNE